MNPYSKRRNRQGIASGEREKEMRRRERTKKQNKD